MVHLASLGGFLGNSGRATGSRRAKSRACRASGPSSQGAIMVVNLVARLALITTMASDRRCGRVHLAVAHLLFCHFYNSQSGRCDPSVASLAGAIGTSRRYAAQAVHDLEAWGYLRVGVSKGTIGKF